MVDKIQKFINRLSYREKELINHLLVEIKNNRLVGLDIKKLKGRDDIYRARKGRVRIIYRLQNGEADVLAVERRSETTYRNF